MAKLINRRGSNQGGSWKDNRNLTGPSGYSGSNSRVFGDASLTTLDRTLNNVDERSPSFSDELYCSRPTGIKTLKKKGNMKKIEETISHAIEGSLSGMKSTNHIIT